MKQPTPGSAHLGFGSAAAGALLAACVWTTGAQAQGLMFDERLWREEVAAGGDDAVEAGWYELEVADDAVRVRAARPSIHEDAPRGDAIYVQLPATRLLEGVRLNYLFGQAGFRPVAGRSYELSLGRTDFRFHMESSGAGTELNVEYGDAAYRYMLGLPAAATRVHAIADLDGDRNPDFLVEVGDRFFMLLSSHAKPGANRPSAQLWAAR